MRSQGERGGADDDDAAFWDIASLLSPLRDPAPAPAPREGRFTAAASTSDPGSFPAREGVSPPEADPSFRRFSAPAITPARGVPLSSESLPAPEHSDISLQVTLPHEEGSSARAAESADGEITAVYVAPGAVIREVVVRRWPSVYRFYGSFLTASHELFAVEGEPCPPVPFFSFVPQYAQLSHAQTRFYLWWRENLRAGKVIPCDFCYLLLFIYEVLNTPDLLPPETGARQLAFLWASYRDRFPRLDKYLGEWLPDYCLIHGVPCPRDLLAPFRAKIFASDITTLREFFAAPALPAARDELARVESFLSFASTYDYRASAFYDNDLFPRHIPRAMRELLVYCRENDPNFAGTFSDKPVTVRRDSYTGAVCAYKWKRQIDLSYLPFTEDLRRVSPIVTDGVKFCENRLRAFLHIPSRLRCTHLTPPMRERLLAYFRRELPGASDTERKESAEPPIDEEAYEPATGDNIFSSERAAQIERASRRVADILRLPAFDNLAEDEENPATARAEADSAPADVTFSAKEDLAGECSPPAIPAPAAPSITPPADSAPPLSRGEPGPPADLADEDESALLRDLLPLLPRGDYDGFLRVCARRGIFPEIAAETVNRAALARLGDVILSLDEGGLTFYDDYLEEVRAWLNELKA